MKCTGPTSRARLGYPVLLRKNTLTTLMSPHFMTIDEYSLIKKMFAFKDSDDGSSNEAEHDKTGGSDLA